MSVERIVLYCGCNMIWELVEMKPSGRGFSATLWHFFVIVSIKGCNSIVFFIFCGFFLLQKFFLENLLVLKFIKNKVIFHYTYMYMFLCTGIYFQVYIYTMTVYIISNNNTFLFTYDVVGLRSRDLSLDQAISPMRVRVFAILCSYIVLYWRSDSISSHILRLASYRFMNEQAWIFR